ncbi:MAG: hypothetical protein LBO64_00800, partial [Desulfovibrio sp.]|nr:hypothetical protein [Desulfovibrio sp.]
VASGTASIDSPAGWLNRKELDRLRRVDIVCARWAGKRGYAPGPGKPPCPRGLYLTESLPLTDSESLQGQTCLHVKPTHNQRRENSRHNSGGHVHKELRHKLILLSGDLPTACLSCPP